LYAAVAAILAYLYWQRVEEELRARSAREAARARNAARNHVRKTSAGAIPLPPERGIQ
jgi:hypothetical protein